MANDKEAIFRAAYVQKCEEATEVYTLYFGKKGTETVMEFPKSWFRGVKRPKKGTKITLIQEKGEVTKMLIDNVQFYPSLNPLSVQDTLPKK